MTPAEALALLATATQTTVEVREPAGGGRVVIRGAGTVEAVHDSVGALVLRERGSWRPQGRPGSTAYTDALRFRVSPTGDRLVVEHVRRGEPVVLVALVPDADGRMRSGAPHVCGADVYTAELEAVGGSVLLRWRIRGPGKDQEVVRSYRVRGDQSASRSFSSATPKPRRGPGAAPHTVGEALDGIQE